MINEKSEQLGKYIRKLRKEKNISAKELGSYVGYSQSYISALETNKNNNIPSKKVINRLADAFHYIGYRSREIEKEMYKICGYPVRFSEFDNGEFMEGYSKYIGSYDNLSNEILNKPYLDLDYLLKNDFNLKFTYKYDNAESIVNITKEQKDFIHNMINSLLKVSGIEETIKNEREKEEEESNRISKEMQVFQIIEEKRDRLAHDLKALNKLKSNFSEESFEYTYDFVLKCLTIDTEDDTPIKFDKDTLEKSISFLTKEIETLRKEYDKLDKED